MLRRVSFFAVLWVIAAVASTLGQKEVPPEGSEITLTFDPPKIDFGESSDLKAHVKPVAEGHTITFCPNIGDTIGEAQTDSDGDADLEYSPTYSGRVEITATDEDNGEEATEVLHVMGTITLEADPDEIELGDDTDLNAHLDGAVEGTAVDFYSGSDFIGRANTDSDGDADLDYTPQTTGDVVIMAWAEDYESDTTDLHVSCPEERGGSPSNPCPSPTPPPPTPTATPGPTSTPAPTSTPTPVPRRITLTANPAQIGTGDITDLHAHASDGAAEINVWYAVNGTSVAVMTTDGNGDAHYQMRGENPGRATVTASADHYVTGSAQVVVVPSGCTCCAWCTSSYSGPFCKTCCLTSCKSEYNRNLCQDMCDVPE